MKNHEWSTSRYDLVSPGPETAEEFDQKAGKSGACLEEAVASVTYRSTSPEFWDAFIPKVEALTGITRGVDEAASARAKERAKDPSKAKDVPEKPNAYDNRVWAQASDEQKAQLVALAKETALSITIDPSPSRRASTPNAAIYAKADSVLSRDTAGIADAVNKLTAAVEGAGRVFELAYDENNKPTRDSLAGLIKVYTEVRSEI